MIWCELIASVESTTRNCRTANFEHSFVPSNIKREPTSGARGLRETFPIECSERPSNQSYATKRTKQPTISLPLFVSHLAMPAHPKRPVKLNSNSMRGNDYDFLRSNKAPEPHKGSDGVSIVDLFCGAGGLSLGIVEACTSLGKSVSIPFAIDFEQKAQSVFASNMRFANVINGDVRDYFSSRQDLAPVTEEEARLAASIGRVDFLVGGPPCQGHSDLNNFSRRNDPKNNLYFIMARAAQALKPKYVLIENVLGARHDRGGIVGKTIEALENLGYQVEVSPVDLLEIGVPQRRKRLVIFASTSKTNDSILEIISRYRTEERNIKWAIGDIESASKTSLCTTPSTPSMDNKKRIDYLFDNQLKDLPDELRPLCHQGGNHSYKSVYGRLDWDLPSQTITSGFYSMCMGRYVHPSQRRTLTAREAARIQFFPDYFSFESAGSRTAIAKLIGNAVPPKLSFAVAYSLLQSEHT